jgi:hypothetical protein
MRNFDSPIINLSICHAPFSQLNGDILTTGLDTVTGAGGMSLVTFFGLRVVFFTSSTMVSEIAGVFLERGFCNFAGADIDTDSISL